jgi:asparagine synthase (glutamine-hydrolysing)
MCGIAGMIRFDGSPVRRAVLQSMASLQVHRGPDDEGLWEGGSVGFAFRRLSIVDLSTGGHQPMTGSDGSTVVVFNGEIYNHNELREQLQDLGHRFRSHSDTEVLLAAYAQWGRDCLSKFNGMWGFALWDARRRKVFIARDRLGVKPVYYQFDRQRLVFASEIKALFADPSFRTEPDPDALAKYLALGTVHFGERTFFSGVRQLPAGHWMEVGPDDAAIEPAPQRYWTVDCEGYRADVSDQEAMDGFRERFADSIRLRLRSDVPVGSCLSGGLDSSSIVCVANLQINQERRLQAASLAERQQTFSACYASAPDVDERRWIDVVTRRTGAGAHHVYPSSAGLVADMDRIVWHQEEPVGGSSIFAQWCVMRLARERGVTVLLDGQGADELLAGYQRYFWAYAAGAIRRPDPRTLLALTRRSAGTLDRLGLRDAAGIAFSCLGFEWQDRLRPYRFSDRDWWGSGLRAARVGAPQAPDVDGPTWLSRTLLRDLLHTNLPALLRYEDRNSMAHSVEARVPFLDYRLVEYVFTLPDRMRIRDGTLKWLLRSALADVLPPETLARRDKIGFATPEHAWLREQMPWVQGVLQGTELAKRGFVDETAVRARVSNPSSWTGENAHVVWRWLNAELWLRRFFVDAGGYRQHAVA